MRNYSCGLWKLALKYTKKSRVFYRPDLKNHLLNSEAIDASKRYDDMTMGKNTKINLWSQYQIGV